mmetsp:Transcript_69933/g.169259  ORF Transcript_69933/g.169259 Transcript_69933/m.169259 type:complete len:343 (+) Transcript_69933:539-1567(+)
MHLSLVCSALRAPRRSAATGLRLSVEHPPAKPGSALGARWLAAVANRQVKVMGHPPLPLTTASVDHRRLKDGIITNPPSRSPSSTRQGFADSMIAVAAGGAGRAGLLTAARSFAQGQTCSAQSSAPMCFVASGALSGGTACTHTAWGSCASSVGSQRTKANRQPRRRGQPSGQAALRGGWPQQPARSARLAWRSSPISQSLCRSCTAVPSPPPAADAKKSGRRSMRQPSGSLKASRAESARLRRAWMSVITGVYPAFVCRTPSSPLPRPSLLWLLPGGPSRRQGEWRDSRCLVYRARSRPRCVVLYAELRDAISTELAYTRPGCWNEHRNKGQQLAGPWLAR